MKAFQCDHCGSLVFFENVQCVRCGRVLGYLPDIGDLSAIEPEDGKVWLALAPAANERRYRQCKNWPQHQVCNWLVPVEDPNPFCVACRLNDMIPDLDVSGNRKRWRKLEAAKRRIIYTLMRLGLKIDGAPGQNGSALRFRFLGNIGYGPMPLTGHSKGSITINISEADDDERERLRVHLLEPYRTLLGHLRHEVAHYYWDQLISGTPRLAEFRRLFGDEELNYDAALQKYYQQGPPADWQSRHISGYASAHPWEDWAESWAHYLHIVDTMETAASFGITLSPTHPDAKAMTADLTRDAEPDPNFDRVLQHWLPLTCALNSLNRGMGLPDLYPFVLSEPAMDKLQFVHEVVQSARMKNDATKSTQIPTPG